MARLPIPGGDKGVWGDILNDFLSVAHNGDGTLKDAVLDATTTTKGKIKLAGDLGGTADVPTVPNAVKKGDLLFNVKDYGAVADSSGAVGNGTDNLAAFNAAQTAASAAGYGVYVPPGKYRLSGGITLGKGQTLVGAGGGQPSDSASAATLLVFDNGINGVTMNGLAAQLMGVMLIGGTGSVNGVTISSAGRTRCVDVSIKGFGQDGYNCDTSVSGNSNIPYCENVRVYTCGRDGFHLAGSNSNAGTFIGCEAVTNANYGIYSAATARNNFVGGHLSGNTVGGIFDGGNSNMYDVYIESGTGGTLNIDVTSSYGIFFGRNYAMPTITGSAAGASSWTINRSGANRGQIRVSDVADSVSGKTWKFDSGVFGAGWLTISNDTDSTRIMRANTASTQAVWYAHQYPNATATYDIGSSSLNWRRAYVSSSVNVPAAQTLAANGAVTIDASAGDAEITLQANATSSSITNAVTGQVLRITWIQDATGGHTYSWPANCTFVDAAPAITTANARVTVTFRYNGTNWNQLSASLSASAVDLSSAQTIGGVKTFSSSPIVPTPTSSTQAATKGYVDGATAGDGWGIPRAPWAANPTSLITIGTANSTWYYRVVGTATISKIRLFVGTSSGNICVAAYQNSGTGVSSVPGTQLATSGSLACPTGSTTTDVSLGSSITVNSGDWLAVACDNTTATFAGITGVGSAGLHPGISYQQTASAFPCPTTPGTLNGVNNRLIALIGVT